MTTNVRVMVPLRITPDAVKSGTTIAEPNTAGGETAWVASATYTAGDEKTNAGYKWLCILGHTGRATAPAFDPLYWTRNGPSDRMSPFDDYTSTKARATGSLTYVIQPGFFGAVKVYGLEGDTCTITLKDEPGGSVVMTNTLDLYAQAAGFYELLFTVLPMLEQVGIDSVEVLPEAELTITVTAGGGGAVAVGDIKVGDWRNLIGEGSFGGVNYGASAERKTYTYRKYEDDGTYTTVIRSQSRDVSCKVTMDAEQAMYADSVLGEIIDRAVPFEVSSLPHYGYLNTLGFVTGSIEADSYGVASLNLNIKGNI